MSSDEAIGFQLLGSASYFPRVFGPPLQAAIMSSGRTRARTNGSPQQMKLRADR